MFFLGRNATSGLNMNTFQADIIGLLTGTITSTASLSSNFVQASSRMNTTVPGGWTLIDAAAGTAANGVTPKVISAPWSDDATKFKYVRISGDVALAYSLQGYEGWNPTTHVGTNIQCSSSLAASNWQTMTPVTDSWLIVSASSTHIFIAQMTSATNFTASQHYFLSEYSRDDAWNTVAVGYPAWFSSGCASQGASTSALNQNAALCRLPNLTATPVVDLISVLSSTTGNAGTNRFKILPPNQNTATDTPGCGLELVGYYTNNIFSMDTSKNLSYQLIPLRLASWNASSTGNQMYGSINAKTPFLYMFKNLWGGGDEVDIDGIRYFYFFIGYFTAPMLIKEQ